jgi:hypothetical protein
MLGGVKVMRIDFNRICKLAGVSNNSSKGLMREGNYSNEMDDTYEPIMEEDEVLPDVGDEEGDADEMVDIDINELMSEIRRAKKIIKMNESKKRRKVIRQKRLQENHLKRIIQKEVDNILSEIEYKDSSWIYGAKKPQHSRKGYTNHGRTLPGIGFGKKW